MLDDPVEETMRLTDKVGIVVGAGQTPGETIGNGRAAALLFAREGAKVLLVDRNIASAQETAALIAKEGGTSQCLAGDWTRASECKAYANACVDAWGRIDFLHNNVGIGAGDASPDEVTEEAFDRIVQVNLKGSNLEAKGLRCALRLFHLKRRFRLPAGIVETIRWRKQ